MESLPALLFIILMVFIALLLAKKFKTAYALWFVLLVLIFSTFSALTGQGMNGEDTFYFIAWALIPIGLYFTILGLFKIRLSYFLWGLLLSAPFALVVFNYYH